MDDWRRREEREERLRILRKASFEAFKRSPTSWVEQRLKERRLAREWDLAMRHIRLGGRDAPGLVGTWPQLVMAGMFFGTKRHQELYVRTEPHASRTTYVLFVERDMSDLLVDPSDTATCLRVFKDQYGRAFEELRSSFKTVLFYGTTDDWNHPVIHLEVQEEGLAEDSKTIEAVVTAMKRCATALSE